MLFGHGSRKVEASGEVELGRGLASIERALDGPAGTAHGRTFVAFRPVLLAMQDTDRAYLRAWILEYVNENGQVMTPPGHSAPRTSESLHE